MIRFMLWILEIQKSFLEFLLNNVLFHEASEIFIRFEVSSYVKFVKLRGEPSRVCIPKFLSSFVSSSEQNSGGSLQYK